MWFYHELIYHDSIHDSNHVIYSRCVNYFIPNKTSILSQFLISLSLTNIKIKISSKYYIRYVRVFSLTFHIFFMKKLIECTNFTLPVFQYNCTYTKSILKEGVYFLFCNIFTNVMSLLSNLLLLVLSFVSFFSCCWVFVSYESAVKHETNLILLSWVIKDSYEFCWIIMFLFLSVLLYRTGSKNCLFF